MKRIVALAVVALSMVSVAAFAAEKGTSMLSIGLSQGQFDGYQPAGLAGGSGSGYIESVRRPELGVTGEYWHMFSSDYALALQGTYGFSSEKWEPGSGAAGFGDAEITSTSFKVRVGGDRVGSIGDRFTWFMGPGLEFWSGTYKIQFPSGTTLPDFESESTTRWGISGRFGGVMQLSDMIGIQGQIGHSFGMATSEAKTSPSGFTDSDDDGAKLTTWTSGFNASWGLNFTFGGTK